MKKHIGITGKIIRAFYEVYNQLGYGFLEKGYENALGIELEGMGFQVKQQISIQVIYRDKVVG